MAVVFTLVDLFRFGSKGEPEEAAAAALVVGKFPELEAVVELSEVMVVMVGLLMFD